MAFAWFLCRTLPYLSIISNPEYVCNLNNLDTVPCEINLDGGNVIKWKGKVILTDRIIEENQEYKDKDGLVEELSHFFKSEIILIPALKKKEL